MKKNGALSERRELNLRKRLEDPNISELKELEIREALEPKDIYVYGHCENYTNRL